MQFVLKYFILRLEHFFADFTNWAWYRPEPGKYDPSDIDTELCTHVNFGFVVLHPTNLVIKVHDPWSDIDNKFFTKVIYSLNNLILTLSIA